MIQQLRLFGNLPMMLELSMNYCTQGCEYCYAKTWKREQIPLDKVVNNILRLETKREGWLPYLIRKREAIAMSNRTDLMCTPDWRERLGVLKKMGFPVYLETKLTKDYRELADILNPETDMVYQTITGLNNKYEGKNHLFPDEKIEAARYLRGRGFRVTVGINPFMPDKCTVDDIKEIVGRTDPTGLVMNDYHTTSKYIDRHLFPPEYPKETMRAARAEVIAWCEKRGLPCDVQEWNHLGADDAPNLTLERAEVNKFLFGGKHFVFDEFLAHLNERFRADESLDVIEVHFADFMEFFAPQIEYFKDVVITKKDYRFHIKDDADRVFRGKETFGIEHFLRCMWNEGEMKMIMDFYKEKGKPELDKNGDMVYFRMRDGFYRDLMEADGNV